MKKTTVTVVIFILIGGVAATVNFQTNVSTNPLSYDEGDYYRAIQKGLWKNWTDDDDIALADFISKGIEAIRGEQTIAGLSDYIRDLNSTAFLRHFHPPLPFYPAMLARSLFQNLVPERQLRLANLFWIFFWLCAAGMILRRLHGPAWFSIFLLPCSTSFGMAVFYFNMHVPFAVFLSLFLLSWVAKEQTGERVFRFAALLFLAGALNSVEYSSFLIGLLGLWTGLEWFRSKHRSGFIRRRLQDLLFLTIFLLILWPPSLITLSLPRSFFFQAYILFFRFERLPLMDSISEALLWKWNSNPLEFLIAVVFVVIVIIKWRDVLRNGPLFVSLGFVVLMSVLHFNRQWGLPWYLFSLFIVVFTVVIPMTLDRAKLLSRWKNRPIPFVGGVLVSGAILLLMSVYLAGRPVEEYRIEIKELAERTPRDTIIAPVSIYTWLEVYHQDRPFLRYHDSLATTAGFADSVTKWRSTRLVITPPAYRPVDTTESAWVNGYRVFKRLEMR